MNTNKKKGSPGKFLLGCFLTLVCVFVFLWNLLFPTFHRIPPEAWAINSLRMIVTAQQQFRILKKRVDEKGNPQYGNFTELNSHEMIEPTFVNGYRKNYNFKMHLSRERDNFIIYASPATNGDSTRMFFVDSSGKVTFSTVSLPDASSAKVD